MTDMATQAKLIFREIKELAISDASDEEILCALNNIAEQVNTLTVLFKCKIGSPVED